MGSHTLKAEGNDIYLIKGLTAENEYKISIIAILLAMLSMED